MVETTDAAALARFHISAALSTLGGGARKFSLPASTQHAVITRCWVIAHILKGHGRFGYDAAAMFGDFWFQELALMGIQAGTSALFIGAHKPAVAGTIAGKHGG